MTHFKQTEFGFEWGSAWINRLFSDKKRGWVTVGIDTPKTRLQIYVTKTGKVRISDGKGEWRKPNKRRKERRGG